MTDSDTTASAAQPIAVATPVRAVVDELSPAAMEQLREYAEETSDGGNRFVWFLWGMFAAVVVGAIASIAFLAISDDDDDGRLNVDVPTVDLSVDG